MTIKSIVYCGTPDFAVPILKELCTSNQGLLKAVITRPDARKGRGKKTKPSPVKEIAQIHDIPTFEIDNKDDFAIKIDDLKPDLVLVAAYGVIISKDIVNRYLCINVHASLLPKYRGASPIHAALLNNEKNTGITLFKISEKMDTGDMYYTFPIEINDEDNLKSLHDKLADLSVTSIKVLLKNLIADTCPTPIQQNHIEATYCQKLSKADTIIDPDESVEQILCKIKAFSPIPGANLLLNDKKNIKIIDAIIKDGALLPTIVKPEGKPEMTYHDYCLGHPDGIQKLGK